jgi:hypothetical protein
MAHASRLPQARARSNPPLHHPNEATAASPPQPPRSCSTARCELWIPKWSEAFRQAIQERTGQGDFDYRIAVTRLKGDAAAWDSDPTISANLSGCSIGFLTLQEMWGEMLERLTTTPAPSEIGRLAQLLKAAGLTAESVVAEPSRPAPGSDAAAVEDVESDGDGES